MAGKMTALERIRNFLSGRKVLRPLEEKTGLSYESMRQWRNGSIPGVDSIEKFCKGADISANWLILGVGPEKLSECSRGGESGNKKIAGRIGPDGPKERILSWLSEQLDENVGWGGIEHAMTTCLRDYGEWLKKPGEERKSGTPM